MGRKTTVPERLAAQERRSKMRELIKQMEIKDMGDIQKLFKEMVGSVLEDGLEGKVERTVAFVRDNFMVGIKYASLDDLNGQAVAWCNKVNGNIHATTAKSRLNG